MSDQTCSVEGCDRPVPDTSFVCPRCGDRLGQLLDAVPGIGDDLDDVIRRQVRFAESHGGRSQERPLPYNPAASESKAVLVGTLTFWAAAVSEQRGHPMPDVTLAALGPYLAGSVPWLRAQAAGPDAFDEITTAVRQARSVTDRPAERRYAGPCTAGVPMYSPVDGAELGYERECGTDLYAREQGDTVTCPECGTEYPLAERRAWLLEQADDQLLPARELARAIDGLGVPLTAAVVAGLKRRGRIIPHGTTPDGRDLFRVGDVRAVVQANAARRGDAPTASAAS